MERSTRLLLNRAFLLISFVALASCFTMTKTVTPAYAQPLPPLGAPTVTEPTPTPSPTPFPKSDPRVSGCFNVGPQFARPWKGSDTTIELYGSKSVWWVIKTTRGIFVLSSGLHKINQNEIIELHRCIGLNHAQQLLAHMMGN